MTASTPPAGRSGRALLLTAGVAGSLALALSITDTLSAFTAAITNSDNRVATGTYFMEERNSDGSVVCSSASVASGTATCSTINKYGGGTGASVATLLPGQSSSTTVRIKNAGSVTPTTFTLDAAGCTQSGSAPGPTTAADLCSQVTVAVHQGTDTSGPQVFSGTLAAFDAASARSLTPPAAGAEQAYTFVVTLDPSVDNTYQNLTAAQAMTWSFG